mgnify:CR=1 FL=1
MSKPLSINSWYGSTAKPPQSKNSPIMYNPRGERIVENDVDVEMKEGESLDTTIMIPKHQHNLRPLSYFERSRIQCLRMKDSMVNACNRESFVIIFFWLIIIVFILCIVWRVIDLYYKRH